MTTLLLAALLAAAPAEKSEGGAFHQPRAAGFIPARATQGSETRSRSDRETPAQLAEQVRQTETAFAKTMADRDHAAFVSFLADETVFFGNARVMRGKDAVAAAWKALYEGKEAPFSWRPEKVEVLDSGTLGLSTGPVFDPAGKQTGTFSSIWRREADGKWRIVFDKGCQACQTCPPAPEKK